jgi:hypothetical protein
MLEGHGRIVDLSNVIAALPSVKGPGLSRTASSLSWRNLSRTRPRTKGTTRSATWGTSVTGKKVLEWHHESQHGRLQKNFSLFSMYVAYLVSKQQKLYSTRCHDRCNPQTLSREQHYKTNIDKNQTQNLNDKGKVKQQCM